MDKTEFLYTFTRLQFRNPSGSHVVDLDTALVRMNERDRNNMPLHTQIREIIYQDAVLQRPTLYRFELIFGYEPSETFGAKEGKFNVERVYSVKG